jgi:F-type H+-transporting ATPase subunit epsilon
MANSIQLEIITPEGVQLTEDVDELTAPSTEGQFGVLPGHRPMLASLKTGIVGYTKGGTQVRIAVGPGFAEINDDSAVLLTDQFCRKEDIDPVRVRLDLKEADKALDEYEGEHSTAEFVDLVAKELWAAARLELYGDPPPATVGTIYEFRGAGQIVESEEEDDSDDSVKS